MDSTCPWVERDTVCALDSFTFCAGRTNTCIAGFTGELR